MVKSNSANLKEKLEKAGIKYIPGDQLFYKRFPYKVELSPIFKGLGGKTGVRGCKIDVRDPEKSRKKLAEFNYEMERLFRNVEYRNEICQFVENLPHAEYKARMGGENNLFYIRDPKIVWVLVEHYKDAIKSVTGPVSSEHESTFGEKHIVMREKLYYNRYRYYMDFRYCEEFVETAKLMLEYLNTLEYKSWRANRLNSCINFYEYHKIAQNINIWRNSPLRSINQGEKIYLYLEDGEAFVYLKILAGEHLISSHEVVLFDELT